MLPKLKTNFFSTGQIFSILEHRISVSGACSRNWNHLFFKQGQSFNFRSTYFSFREHAPKNEIFVQFWKKILISGAGFTNSGAWIFLSVYLYIYLSTYLYSLFVYKHVYLDVRDEYQICCTFDEMVHVALNTSLCHLSWVLPLFPCFLLNLKLATFFFTRLIDFMVNCLILPMSNKNS